jgi:hypothetical protein
LPDIVCHLLPRVAELEIDGPKFFGFGYVNGSLHQFANRRIDLGPQLCWFSLKWKIARFELWGKDVIP